MRFEQGGISLDYSNDGQGMPVVLLHAFGTDRTLWRAQVDALKDRFRVIVPSLRGFGDSTGADGGAISMDQYADDVARLLDHVNVRAAVVVGLSLGGYVALALALRHAARTRGLVLANTRASADAPESLAAREELARAIQSRGAQALVEFYGERLFGSRCGSEAKAAVRAMMRRQATPGLMSATRGMAQRPDRIPQLAEIRAPTLVIHGEEDVLIGASEAEILHRGIAGSRRLEIPGAGHLSNVDSPAAFGGALGLFLESIMARRA